MSLPELLSWIIQYAVLQGLFLGSWLIIRKRQLFFAAFLFNISYLLLVFMVEVEGSYRQLPHLIWTNVPSWFLIAPLLYLEAEITVRPNRTKFHPAHALHFVPAVGALVYMLPFYLLPAEDKIELFEGFYSGEKIVDYVQMIYLVQIGLYAVFGKKFLQGSLNNLKENLSHSEIVNVSLLNSTYFLLGFYIATASLLAALLNLIDQVNLSFYAVAFLSLALMIISATFIFIDAASLNPLQEPVYEATTENEQKGASQKYAHSSLSTTDMQKLVQELENCLREKKPYRNPELKLSDLSRLSEIPSHHISQALNQVLRKNFFTYINEKRVEAVIDQLKQGRHHSLTLIAIAGDCGFKSQSSFYRIFKSHTGLTPKAYLNKVI